MSEQIILKVLDPQRLVEVYAFLLEHFKLCGYCGGFFDGETDYCSPECDVVGHTTVDWGD